MFGKAIRQTMFGQSKVWTIETQQHARADKGTLKGQILHPSAVKINCKSFCEVAYANFAQIFFATVRRYQ